MILQRNKIKNDSHNLPNYGKMIHNYSKIKVKMWINLFSKVLTKLKMPIVWILSRIFISTVGVPL